MPAAEGTADDAPRQFLRLALGEEAFAAPIDSVREILGVGRLTQMPRSPAFVRGVMNLRGAVVPVIDLGARLGRPVAAIGRRSCVVVVEIEGQTEDDRQVVGALVDGVHEVLEVGHDDLEPVPALGTPVDPQFLCGLARVRGAICAVLDLERALSPQALAALIESHEQARA